MLDRLQGKSIVRGVEKEMQEWRGNRQTGYFR